MHRRDGWHVSVLALPPPATPGDCAPPCATHPGCCCRRRYYCEMPANWIATELSFDFILSSNGEEEFAMIRELVDPTTGVKSTVPTYSDGLTVIVNPIDCAKDHSLANFDGSQCICDRGYYRRTVGESFSCERCPRGTEPDVAGRGASRCEACLFGKFSPDGESCENCLPGNQPNLPTGADRCQTVKRPASIQDCFVAFTSALLLICGSVVPRDGSFNRWRRVRQMRSGPDCRCHPEPLRLPFQLLQQLGPGL